MDALVCWIALEWTPEASLPCVCKTWKRMHTANQNNNTFQQKPLQKKHDYKKRKNTKTTEDSFKTAFFFLTNGFRPAMLWDTTALTSYEAHDVILQYQVVRTLANCFVTCFVFSLRRMYT